MNIEKEFPTKAFEKYVDPIFIIENDLMFVAPKKLDDRLDPRFRYQLETYDNEQSLWAGMCCALAMKISKELKFENTKNIYNKKMLSVASNHNLDYIETEKEIEKLNKTLFSHAKLQYCLENYLNKITLNNNLSILVCLTAMYAQILKIQKEKRPNERIQDFARTKWYRYVREAMLEEESFDIKNYSKYSLQSLSEVLFNLIVECEYYLKNSTDEMMVGYDGKNKLQNINLEIFVIEGDNTFENFKAEQEILVQNWLTEEMYKNERNTM
ncbi:MAG: hypothetical protein J6Q13_00620 [Clostridia bacterium]|nr:hypothetical protein [Clostridia bacterium]